MTNQDNFVAKAMRREFCRKASAVVYVVLALEGVVADHDLRAQPRSVTPSPFGVGAGRHQTHAQWQNSMPAKPDEMARENQLVIPPRPTRSSFMATWAKVSGAKGYLLDVSTSDSFSSFVDGYQDLDVGNVTGRVVTPLEPGTTYYYRVRAYDMSRLSPYSATIAVTTDTTTGLIIHPTFDSSITGNPNSAAIQATINAAISMYESLLTDPITIEIRFRYSTTEPNGDPIPAGRLAQSNFVIYTIPWNTYVEFLRADASSANDNAANASLPTSALSANIQPASADGRAVGLDTPTAMFADGTVGAGGPYDGIVTLNSSSPYQFTRPPSGGNYDAQRAFEHEMDEVIGLGSHLSVSGSGSDLRPQDLFSWSSTGQRNTSSSGVRYFSINGGVTNIVNFNQDSHGDFGDWLSDECPQGHPYVQNAFLCTGQSSDVTATSPEGINLDVIGYGLANTGIPTPTPTAVLEACYPNFTTAEGCDALRFLTAGAGNTALGWRSLFSNTTGSFNTGVGAGVLVLNNESSNTSVGAASLLLNATGSNNTAAGADALVFNDSGSSNTASGYFALMNNTAGESNTAIGSEALIANTRGNNNTAGGNLALSSSETTTENVCVGRQAGSGITAADNNIIIGHHSGIHTVFGQESDKCYIDNIHGAPVSATTATTVTVDSDGRLGTAPIDGTAAGAAKGNRLESVADPVTQAMLEFDVRTLEATITRQQQEIQALTAALKEQNAQIREVNARVEMRKPAAKMVANKH